jgi:hypothetical protein
LGCNLGLSEQRRKHRLEGVDVDAGIHAQVFGENAAYSGRSCVVLDQLVDEFLLQAPKTWLLFNQMVRCGCLQQRCELSRDTSAEPVRWLFVDLPEIQLLDPGAIRGRASSFMYSAYGHIKHAGTLKM